MGTGVSRKRIATGKVLVLGFPHLVFALLRLGVVRPSIVALKIQIRKPR